MSKGSDTKVMIVEKAALLFADKGYATVTMKDVCQSTGLSRGGLYRYFSSTKEIFLEILNRDFDSNNATVDKAFKSDTPALHMLQYYLNQEKAALFKHDRGFYFAIHEFAFLEEDQKDYFNERVRKSSELLSKILIHGQRRKEFKLFDVEVVSRHILCFWDSLKTSSSILSLTEEEVDKQIAFILEIIR